MSRVATVLLALGLCSIVGCSPPGFQVLRSISSSHVLPVHGEGNLKPPYVGVSEPGTPPSFRPVLAFTNATDVRSNVVLYYSGWNESFETHLASTAYKHGATLLVQINPRKVPLSRVAAGRYDKYLRSYAAQVRDFGHPVIVGFAHEMNGSWYPWGYPHTAPHIWVAAWRHVVTVFRRAGARNVIWLWTASHLYPNRYRSYWPGAKYVTWVGIDGYLAGSGASFNRTFALALKDVRGLTNKPVLLAETAVSPKAHNQAADVVSLFAGVEKHHLLGLVYFDVGEHTWRLEGHPKLLRAFRRGAALLGIR